MTDVMTELDTVALAPPAVVSGFRMPRVNLLPPEIEQARQLRSTQRALAGGLLGVVVLLGGGYAYEVHARHGAEQALADVKAQTTLLQGEQAKYADVPRTVAAIDAAETARQTAMANDVEWSRTLTDFSLSLPENVWFSNVSLTLRGASTAAVGTPTTGATPTPGAASGLAAAGIGAVSVEGSARSHRDVAAWLDTLATLPGMSDAYFSSSQKQKVGSTPVVKFSSTATLTADALSHRYDRKQG